MTRFKIGTSDVLFVLAMLSILGGFRLMCRVAVWFAHVLGVI